MSGGSQNTQSAQGGITGLLAKAPDPLGISNGGGALDPMNLMGSMPQAPGVPSTLPNLGIKPQFYGGKFIPASTMGGDWNAMAQRMAGSRYVPSAIPQARPQTQPQPGPAGNGAMPPGLIQMLLRNNPNFGRQ